MGSLETVVDLTDGSSRSCRLAGEARLDNRAELLAELSPWLPPAQEVSDAGLILAAWRRWGERCPERLLGDFAFVLWDGEARKVLCARDPSGVRPLCYSRVGDRLFAASTAEQILGNPEVPRRLDPTALGDYLTGLPGDPERTFFLDVRRLPPGHRLLASSTAFRVERFWEPDASGQTLYRRDEEYAERFLEVFRQAVRDRLRTSSRTVAIALSGGLDSSAVAAVARQEISGNGGSPDLYACSFTFERLASCNEKSYVETTARSLGIETVFLDAERFWFLGDDEAYTPGLDSPLLTWEGCFRHLASLLHGRKTGLLLTGHGADDLLRGSFRVYADRLRRGDPRVLAEVWRYAHRDGRGWRTLYRCLAEPLLPRSIARSVRFRLGRAGRPAPPPWIAANFARRTGLAERLAEAVSLPRTAREEMCRSLVTHPTAWRSAEWYHRVLSPFGIEVCHPFLDRRLVELVLSFPPAQVFRLGTYKPLLRKAMAGLLPEPVRLRRDKTRLGGFLDYSLREKEAARIESLFAKPVAGELGILDGAGLRKAFQRYKTGEPDDSDRALWWAITVELWLRRHFRLTGGGPRQEAWVAA